MAANNTSGASTPKGRRNDVVAAEKERFGGIKWGSAFFGWLTAIGLTVLLSALATAVGAGVGAANTSGATDAANQATENAETIGIVSGIVLAVVLFIAYGSILWGVLPTAGSNISWQAHLFGALGGILAAFLLKRKRPAPGRADRFGIGS